MLPGVRLDVVLADPSAVEGAGTTGTEEWWRGRELGAGVRVHRLTSGPGSGWSPSAPTLTWA